ncbi:hypothetical protein [Nocardioides sp. AE5]|uniref:hypothetical protein n=1 Tax=Nocardioides sp. AE5 TaxID=2962573 RepID=UPI002880F82B|nr:hypothetical protein [Nocardioides sp. AE5]MDT0203963.1 hypothetical protein [Nocardioides sp. AE5]
MTRHLFHAARALRGGLLCALLLPMLVLAAPAHAESEVRIEEGAGLGAEQEQQIRDLVAEAEGDIVVVALAEVSTDDRRSARLHAHRVLEESATDLGRKRAVLVFSPTSLPTRGVASDDGSAYSAAQAVDLLDGTEQEKFVALVDLVVHDRGEEEFEAALERYITDRHTSRTDNGWQRTRKEPSRGVVISRWIAIGVGVVIVGALLVFRGRALLEWWRRRRRSAGIRKAAGTAQARNLADRARGDLLAFGQAIDAQPMEPHHALQLWHLALDDYDEATRIADAPDDERDDQRIITLCARGQERLAKAVAPR